MMHKAAAHREGGRTPRSKKTAVPSIGLIADASINVNLQNGRRSRLPYQRALLHLADGSIALRAEVLCGLRGLA